MQFSPWQSEFWVDEHGNHPNPLTVITVEDINSGKFKPSNKNFNPEEMHFSGVVITPFPLWPNHCVFTYPNGTLVEFTSATNVYTGMIVGACSYDNAGTINGYLVRYVVKHEDSVPQKPYTVVDKDVVKPIEDWPEDFFVCGGWSASPDDRCESWKLVKENGLLMVVPNV